MADEPTEDLDLGTLPKKAKVAPTLTLTSKPYGLELKKSFQIDDDNCDIVFIDAIDGSSKNKLSAHRMVLSVRSPYFLSMFQGDWKEKDQEHMQVPGGFQWEVFEAVISFMYGKDVKIEEGFLPELLRAADYLELANLKMAVDEGFKHWKLEDDAIAVNVCLTCQEIDLTGSKEYIASHIEQVMNEDIDIGCLPMETIVFISQSEKVKVSEDTLHAFLTKWTNAYAQEQSLSFAQVQDIFSNVRYGTISEGKLRLLARNKYYHNLYFGSALNQYPSLDLAAVHGNPKQYCSRESQLPFPGPAVYNESGSKYYKSVIYAGHANANLNAKLESGILITSLRVEVLSITDKSQCLQIKIEDHARCSPLVSTRRVPIVHVVDEKEINSFCTCRITLNKTSIEITFEADKQWPRISSSKLKAFPFEGPLPWRIGISNCKDIHTN